MKHLVLLGDSIFDNKSYVGGGLDVVSHLRQQTPLEWQVSLRAVDGSVIENVRKQILALPSDATHLFVSIGGNNAILNADVLQMQVSSSTEVFARLADSTSTFEHQYREMLRAILSLNKPTTVCTIYYPRIPKAFAQKIAVASPFNI